MKRLVANRQSTNNHVVKRFQNVVIAANETVIELGNNKVLTKQRKNRRCERQKVFASDICSVFGFAGLLVMIIDNELIVNGVYEDGSVISNLMASFISFLTVLLEISIIYYHSIMFTSGVKILKLDFTFKKIFIILTELIICAPHPIPGDFRFTWYITTVNSTEAISADYNLRIIFSILMVGRFYLFVRSLLFHLTVFKPKYQIIGKLNAVDFSFGFKVKTLMTMYPGRVLIISNFIYFWVASWYLRLSESGFNGTFKDFSHCTWMIIVTFLTVGYGDLTPLTFIGRTIAMVTGFVGIGSSSLLIAVFTKKLTLSKMEDLVHDYIESDQIQLTRKELAANIIQRSWKCYKKSKQDEKKSKLILRDRKLNSLITRTKVNRRKILKERVADRNSPDYKHSILEKNQQNLMNYIKIMSENQKVLIEKFNQLEAKLAQSQLSTNST